MNPAFYTPSDELRRLVRNHPANTDTAGRVRWLMRFFRSGAHLDMRFRSDALIEKFGLSDRLLDSCFEMGDSDEVVAAFIPLLLADEQLEHDVRDFIGAESLDVWKAKASEINSRQLTMF